MLFRKVIILVVIALAASSVLPGPVNRANAEDNVCQQILTRAMERLDQLCGGIARSQACYANNLVKSEPNGDAQLKFDTTGDIAAIKDIRTMVTSPLDAQQGTWGLSLMKLQANLPDSLPGQNVTF